MKKIKLLFAVLALLGGANSASAQITDVTSTYLVNPSFETLKASDGTTDVTVKTKLESGLYGWSIDNSAMSDYQVESEASKSSSGFVNGGSITPTEGTYYYFNRKGWANLSTTLSTTTKAEVEPGTYYVVFDYKAADYSNKNNASKNGTTIGITVKDATDATLATLPAVKRAYSVANDGSNPGTDSYMKDARWCKMGVAFTVETASAITISVQQNMVNNGRSDIVYDNFKLYKIGESQEIDFSGYIANPFFETANKNAWTNNGGNVRRGGYEIWHVNNAKVNQTVNGLPSGKYRVSMQALHGEGESANSLLYAKVGETEKTAPATEPTTSTGGSAFGTETDRITKNASLGKISAEIEVTNGSLELGFKQTAGSQWDVFSNFTLTYIDPAVSALAFDLPANGAMVAGQWYKYVVANTGEYTVSATTAGDIKVTEDVLLSEYSGSAIETGTEVNLTAGTYYYKSTSNNTLTITINNPIQPQRDAIIANKGDITSLINGDFETNADGWTGGNRVTGLARSWKSGSVNNAFYERLTNGSLSYTLHNMPAGTYKVVAAARGYDGGQITPEIAGTTGATLNTIGDARSAESGSEINLNGVEMPYSNLGGFTTNDNGHNWKWITATGTLAEDGDLVINFNCVGNSWMPIDDVHLYCTSLDATSYTRTVGDGKGTINTSNYVVTADIILENPNTILRSTGKVPTAAGDMNNNQYNSSRITKLVLYDGYDFTNSGDNYGLDNGAILYRNIPANTWCTLMVPFYPTNLDAKKVPSSIDGEGVLTFVDAPSKDMNDSPMLVKSTEGVTSITGLRNSTYGITKGSGNYGSGVPMTGVYSAGNVPVSDVDNIYYALGTDNNLHKVTGSEVTIAPFRAYFTLNTSGGSEARSALRMNFGDVTGVANVEVATETTVKDGKYIENGKIVIVKNGIKYNTAGQQVK